MHRDSLPLPVVAAIVERDGRVLVAQRPDHKHQARKWEFPGGKVEPDETPEAALVREIREELHCEVCVIRPLPRSIHAYDRKTVELIPFVCRLVPGSPDPTPVEHLAVAWVRPDELAGYELAAADLPVASILQSPAPGAGSSEPGLSGANFFVP